MAIPTELHLEEILSRHNIAKEDFDKECSLHVRYQIAVQITNWRMMGHYFGIPNEKIVAIQVENRTEEERRVALLRTWSEREGKQATYLNLIRALYHRRRCDLVDSLCSLIKLKSDVGPRDTPCDSLQPSSGMLL